MILTGTVSGPSQHLQPPLVLLDMEYYDWTTANRQEMRELDYNIPWNQLFFHSSKGLFNVPISDLFLYIMFPSLYSHT